MLSTILLAAQKWHKEHSAPFFHFDRRRWWWIDCGSYNTIQTIYLLINNNEFSSRDVGFLSRSTCGWTDTRTIFESREFVLSLRCFLIASFFNIFGDLQLIIFPQIATRTLMKQHLERGQAIEGTVLSSVQRQKLHPAAGPFWQRLSMKSVITSTQTIQVLNLVIQARLNLGYFGGSLSLIAKCLDVKLWR
jgi:hypothetical protein